MIANLISAIERELSLLKSMPEPTDLEHLLEHSVSLGSVAALLQHAQFKLLTKATELDKDDVEANYLMARFLFATYQKYDLARDYADKALSRVESDTPNTVIDELQRIVRGE